MWPAHAAGELNSGAIFATYPCSWIPDVIRNLLQEASQRSSQVVTTDSRLSATTQANTHKCPPLRRPGNTPLPRVSHRWRDGSLNRTTWALKNKPSHEADCAALKLSNKTSGTHGASSAKPIRSLSQSASRQVAEANCHEALWFSQQTDRASGGSDMRPARGVGELNSGAAPSLSSTALG